MAIENERKSPIDWKFGHEESDEYGVLVDVTLTIHDMEFDSYMEKEIKTYRFSFEEVDAKLNMFGVGNEKCFSKTNASGELVKEIGGIEEDLNRVLAKFARDSLADAKIPPKTKVSLAKDFFLNNNYCQEAIREAARLTIINGRINTIPDLEVIKANQKQNDYYLGVVNYCQ